MDRLQGDERVAGMEKTNAYSILVWEMSLKASLGRPKERWDTNKMDLREIFSSMGGGWNWLNMAFSGRL